MTYKLQITRDQIIKDIKTVICQHQANKVDKNPRYPEYEANFKSEIDLADYFFYNHGDVTQLSLHEYKGKDYFGLYFNHKDGDKDSWEPIIKATPAEMLSSDKLIDDIYKHLVGHISFMNSLKK